ncbi:porin [Pseudotabrizicola sediminis]|uniref:Porin n=1 Tax=Pseudotabrizicola sediminis TaxID=2486418 RepID=A0ABY2KPA5_9RHOB|nr:porin [Pseudotabrizicola sediminis]TGD44535.1 porin [Pseudotabrizicola sediminis]
MKKVLLASTVLAMTATVAAAEITVSGSARMGVIYTEDRQKAFFDVDNKQELQFSSRIRIVFTASGETDTGLAFGGTIRADNAAGGNAGTAGSVFMSGAFGRLSMGDVNGAAEQIVGDLAGVGFTGLGDKSDNMFLGNGGIASIINDEFELPFFFDEDQTAIGVRPTALYVYSTGGLTFALSADNPGNDVNGVLERVLSVAVGYSVDSYSFGVGYESAKADGVSIDHVVASAGASFSGVDLKAVYGRSSDLDFKQYGLSASYSVDAIGVSAFHRVEDFGGDKTRYTGIGASYDLGGNAAVVGGLVNTKADGASGRNTADLGLTFSF